MSTDDLTSVNHIESEPPSTKVGSLLHQGKQMPWLGLAELRSIATSNTTLAIVDQAVVSGTRFLTTIFIGRLCGKEELGVYTLMFAVYLVFACLQESLAAAPYVVFGNRLKGASRHAFAGSVLLQSLVIGMAAMLIVGGGSMMVWSGYGPAELAPTSLALAVVLPFMLLWQLARNIAIAHLKLVHALALDVATAALQVAGVAWLAWRSELTSAGGYLALGAGCACTGLAWVFLFRHKLQFRRSQLASDWRRNWRFGRWVLASQIVGTLHGYMPAWVLVVAIGTAATGVFSACESIVLLSNPLILAIANLYGATTARAYVSGGYSEVRQIVWQASLYSSAAMTVLWLLLFLFGGQLVMLLYGEDFAGNGQVIGTIALAAPFWAVSAVIAVALRAVGRPDIDFRAKIVGLLVTLICSVATVNAWGVPAVAYALVAGSVVSCLFQAWAFYLKVPASSLAK